MRRYQTVSRRFGVVLHRWVASLDNSSKHSLLLLADFSTFLLALSLAVLMSHPLDGEEQLVLPTSYIVLLALTGLPLIWFGGLPHMKLRGYDWTAVLKTASVSLGLVLGGLILDRLLGPYLPAATYVLAGLLLFALQVLGRLAMIQILLWVYRRQLSQRRVVIFGAGATGSQLASALYTQESIEAVAFIDDNRALRGLRVAGLPVYGPDELPELVASKRIDRILLAMPKLPAAKLSLKLVKLQSLGIDVHAVPSFTRLAGEAEILSKIAPISVDDLLGRNQLTADIPDATDVYAGKSVLVTGAGGSIGAELCRQLMACGARRIVLFEMSEPALYQIDRDLRSRAHQGKMRPQIVPVLGSVLNGKLLRQVIAENEVEAVLHAAAYKHVPLVEANPLAGLQNNVLGTKIVADAAREAGVGLFLLVSTDKAVRPRGVMGASKRLAEMIVQDLASRPSQTSFTIVRFGNVLGSSGSVIPLFEEQIARGGPVTLTHEEVTRYFMTIPEAAGLVLSSAKFASGGEVFVLDMGDPVPIRRLAEQMIVNAGLTVLSDDNPQGDIRIEVTGLRPGEKLHEELLIGAGKVTTPHPKILRVQEDHLSEIEVATMLRELTQAVETREVAAALRATVRWVGEHGLAASPAALRSNLASS